MTDTARWKTEEYHGYDLHVCSQRRAVRASEAAGADDPGGHWDYTLRITPHGIAGDADEAIEARSGPDSSYGTQAIAESMGFLKGREMIDSLIPRYGGAGDYDSRVL